MLNLFILPVLLFFCQGLKAFSKQQIPDAYSVDAAGSGANQELANNPEPVHNGIYFVLMWAQQ
jgi:hypothetical protein